MNVSLRCLVLFALISIQGIAFADPFDDAMDAGEAAFTNKEYAKARAEFQRAYDIRAEPLAIYNIAQTYRFENNTTKAIEYYKKYKAESAAAEDLRAKADKYIQDLEEAERRAGEQRKAKLENGPKNPDRTPAEVPKPPITQEPSLTVGQPGQAGQTDVVHKRRVPLGSKIAAGITGLGLISALVFTKLGLDAEDDLKNNTMPTQEDADNVERYQNLINISWGVTGAAAITAVVIYFAAPSYSTDKRNIAIAPNRDGGWTAALTMRF